MSLVEVVLRVEAPDVELAVAHLLDYAPAGFRHDELPDGSSEFGIYVQSAQSNLVEPYLARAGVIIASADVLAVPSDYADRWKQFHNAVTIGGLWVGPPWQLDDAPADHKRIVIDPGQGFGTGAHPTTRLMLTLLLEQPRASLLDVGCGSGVLAIAAAMLGFAPIIAVDNDPAAVQSTHENIERNAVGDLIEARVLDALADPLPKADIVLANITLEPLQALAPRLHAPRVVVSGLLRSQVEAASASFEQYGYATRDRRDRDGWAALVLDNVREGETTMYNRDVF